MDILTPGKMPDDKIKLLFWGVQHTTLSINKIIYYVIKIIFF